MRSTIRLLRQHRRLVVLLLSGFMVPLLTNLLSSWMETTLGSTPAQLLRLLAVLLGMAIALWVLYLALSGERKKWVLVPREWQPSRFPGLILLVGPGRPDADPLEGPNAPAIDYHLGSDNGEQTLGVCWLVASSQGIPVAEALRSKYQARCKVEIVPVDNAFDIQQTHDAVRKVYLEKAPKFELAPSQVIADFTGGTRVMTAGMTLACGDHWPMQYTTGRPDSASVPMLIQFQTSESREEAGKE